MRNFLLILALFFSIHLSGQFFYDFENNNLSSWIQSETDHWAITSNSPIDGIYSLQHNFDAAETDTDKIALPLNNIDLSSGTTTWKFTLRHGYSPSGTNRWIVFLAADQGVSQMYPGGTINGYAIGVNVNTTDDILRLYRFDNGSATEIINTGINWETEIGTSIAPGITITRSASGHWEFFIDKTGSFNNPVLAGQNDDNTYTSAAYFGVYYQFTSAQDRKLWLDDITIATAEHDANSTVANGPDTEPTAISSVINDYPGTQVFDFTIKDNGTDGLPTKIRELILTQGTDNTITNWTDAIAGAIIDGGNLPSPIYGQISANTIKFDIAGLAYTDDNSEQTYVVKIWLKKDLSNAPDNSSLQFVLSSQNILTDTTGSSFSENSVNYTKATIDISASQLKLSDYPVVIKPSTDFPITVKATDINGNTDTDFNGDITISAINSSGTLTSASGLSKTAASGIASWNDLSYDALDTFNIIATTSSLPQAQSNDIICNTYIYYLNDDFEDGDISDWTMNYQGHWAASSELPVEGNYSLKETYDNQDAAIEWITHQVSAVDFSSDLEWRALIKYENQGPSGSNNWNMLLMSDKNPATENENSITGYLVGINFNSTDDNITLWKLENGTYTSLLVTSFNWESDMDASSVLALRIYKTASGDWDISISTNGNFDDLASIGTVNDNSLSNAAYTGFRYEYSSTLDRKLTIDKVYFGEPIPDTTPPAVTAVEALNPDKLLVTFGEKIENTSATTLSNYIVDNNIQPSSAILNTDNKSVTLQFSNSFDDNLEHSISISNVKDLSNNIMLATTKTFEYIPPKVTGFNFPDESSIILTFNRELDAATVGSTNNYLIDNTINPTSVSLTSANSVRLDFGNPFVSGTSHTIVISNVTDIYGNSLNPAQYQFVFFVPGPHDIIFNEIMADVYPAPNGLPANKYIELYNRTGNEINLSDWTLQIGTYAPVTITELTIPAKSYAIICSPEAEDYFAQITNVSAILNESYLTTTGRPIVLKNIKNITVDSVYYNQDWYNDPDKSSGGWSLERIDPDNVCNQNINWHASTSYTGGTPGFVNSVLGKTQDTEKPYLVKYAVISAKDLDLYFSEPLDKETVANQLAYVLNSSSTPLNIYVDSENPVLLHLFFPAGFATGENNVHLSALSDMCGNTINDTTMTFEYQPIHPTDVEPISDYQLKIYFSENVNAASASVVSNYLVEGMGNPLSAFVDPNDSKNIYLTFSQNFVPDKTYSLTVENITDLYNNAMTPETLQFTLHHTEAFDVVFNEIMSDVNPAPAGLPAAQYLELYNRTDFDIWLTNWKLYTGDETYRQFIPVKISAHDYLLVTTPEYYDSISIFGKTVAILKSGDLGQSDGTLALKTSDNSTIDYLEYDKSWYDDTEKDNGGWSLEKINPDNLCENSLNWTASTDATGGTPSKQNSAFNETNYDQTAPDIDKIEILDAKNITVSFTKYMNETKLTDTNSYSLSTIGKPITAKTNNFKTVELTFASLLQDNTKYTLNFNNLTDNCGNTLATNSYDFVYYKIHVEKLYPVDERQLMVVFSETPSGTTASQKENYTLDGSIKPDFAIVSSQNPKIVFLGFSTDFSEDVTHTLHVENISDNYGRTMDSQDIDFVYYIPRENDITINEILFNPLPDGSDFIEIYNNSQYPVFLRDLYLSRYTADSTLDDKEEVATDFSVIQPGEYIALCNDTTAVAEDYFTRGKTFIQMDLPSMPDDEGNVVLLFKDSIIDYMFYEEQMHSRLLADPEGVSLEKINPQLASSDKNNWHSAAQTVGFATPATQNSQYIETADSISLATVELSSQTFSPDNDGYEDYLYINYKTAEGNIFATVIIADQNGRIIKHITQDELLAGNGFWTWDGFDDNSRLANQGIYIVIVKFYTVDGKVQVYRKAFALVKKVK